jgi:ubiquinone/menaquinone biosynthesis C-methylase UbiE
MHILDIGCGIGGPSRYFAAERGCRVTGIDLTEAYVETARALSRLLGFDDRVSYRQASALALPFEAAAFDGAYMMHVGMNIEDKARLFSEVRRVLKPGAQFALFDIMRTGAGELRFPVHWAASRETSFVASPATYRDALRGADFELVNERDRGDFARDYFRKITAGAGSQNGPPPSASIS